MKFPLAGYRLVRLGIRHLRCLRSRYGGLGSIHSGWLCDWRPPGRGGPLNDWIVDIPIGEYAIDLLLDDAPTYELEWTASMPAQDVSLWLA